MMQKMLYIMLYVHLFEFVVVIVFLKIRKRLTISDNFIFYEFPFQIHKKWTKWISQNIVTWKVYPVVA